MGYTDLATSWEPVSATQWVVPSVDRDFSRPKENYIAESLPINSKNKIKDFQKFLNQFHPVIGLVYQGPIDGAMNDSLGQALKEVEDKISLCLNMPATEMIFNHTTQKIEISLEDLQKTLNFIIKNTNKNIKKAARFQDLFIFYQKIIK